MDLVTTLIFFSSQICLLDFQLSVQGGGGVGVGEILTTAPQVRLQAEVRLLSNLSAGRMIIYCVQTGGGESDHQFPVGNPDINVFISHTVCQLVETKYNMLRLLLQP